MIPSNRAQLAYWNGPMGHLWAQVHAKRDHDHAPMTEALLALAAAASGEHVLDIGCGSGTTALRLAEQVGTEGSVTGIDLSGPMLAVAERRARESKSQARFIEADVTDYPFSPQTFDLAFSQFGVMFFADPAASLANVFAAMKEGGRLAFVCWRASTENPWDVSGCVVLSATGFALLDEAACKVVGRWKFKPATQEGKATSSFVRANIVFRLR